MPLHISNSLSLSLSPSLSILKQLTYIEIMASSLTVLVNKISYGLVDMTRVRKGLAATTKCWLTAWIEQRTPKNWIFPLMEKSNIQCPLFFLFNLFTSVVQLKIGIYHKYRPPHGVSLEVITRWLRLRLIFLFSNFRTQTLNLLYLV